MIIERKETDKEIIVIYKRYALLYYIYIAIFLLVLVLPYVGFYNLILQYVACFAYLIFISIYYIEVFKPLREIRQATKDGKVGISGSKFSFKNPFKYTISK